MYMPTDTDTYVVLRYEEKVLFSSGGSLSQNYYYARTMFSQVFFASPNLDVIRNKVGPFYGHFYAVKVFKVCRDSQQFVICRLVSLEFTQNKLNIADTA